ncbi:hypothetical protein ABZV91_29125 [Nocardia sp. NPDC004568]|uniref:hypothetical protein n=1 Tax=Nocardia sp. NPDC004568 TaxID=3154551 RepID=UPI0033AD7396
MTGVDPDYISAMEHFEAMRHEDIHRATQQIDAGEILRISGTWMHAATTLQTSLPLTRAGADRVMNAMEWDGEAADAAFASTRSFADSVEELAGVLGQVGLRLGAVAAAAEAVKIAVVPPGDSGPVGALARLLEAAKVIDAQMVQEVLRQEAILTMNMVYKPAYLAAGTAVPALPEPPAAPGPLPPLGPPPAPRAQVDTAVGANSAPATGDSGAPAPGDEATESGPADRPSPRHDSTQENPAPPAPENDSAPAAPTPETPAAPESVPTPSPEQGGGSPPPAPEVPEPADGSAPPEEPAPGAGPPAPPVPPPAAEQPPAKPPEPEPPAAPNPTAVPLSDPAGQPGITGPVPGQRAPDQPGVIPPQP